MTTRTSTATWNGTLKEGNGHMVVGKGHYEGPFTYASRFESGEGTNPEELIGAANAGCFSMFLSALLTKANYTPGTINTSATVHLNEGTINLIELACVASVPGIGNDEFQKLAVEAKQNCPISKVLAAAEIRLVAELK